MREISLVEYQAQPAIRLTRNERDLIHQIAPGITISPTPGEDDRYDLTPDSRVGGITIGDLAIEIRPKVTQLDHVLFLMSYALDPKAWKTTGFDFGESRHLHEAVIPGFGAQIRRALRRGILQGYRYEEAALPSIRGRIRFDDQIRDRYGIFPPVEVSYDEFTEDIEPNRLIKAAIARLQRLRIRSPELRAQLRTLGGRFERVQLQEYHPADLPEFTYTRLNRHYRPAVELSKLILRSITLELSHGRTRAAAFLVDMNTVFEDFVVVALREALGLTQESFPQNAEGKSLRLDEAENIGLEPDISWWDGKVCHFVGDVKYKRVSASGIKHPDLYQLLAYTIASGLPSGLLVYAVGEGDAAVHEVVDAGKQLHVVVLDLRGEPRDILAEIDRVAVHVRAMRAQARHLAA